MLKCFQSVRNTFSRRDVPVDEEYELQGKDEITLAIESNNEESIRTAFERLTPEGFNRRRDVRSGYTPLHEAVRLKSSNAVKALLESEHVDVELLDERSYKARKYICDKETAKLFTEYYDRKISNLSREIASSDKKLVPTKRILWTAKFIFASLACLGSIGTYIRYSSVKTEDESTIEKIFLVAAAAGIVLFFNTCIDKGISHYEEKNSSLRKERENCIGERYKVERKLYDLRKEEAFPYARADLAAPRTFQAASTSASASVYSPERVV